MNHTEDYKTFLRGDLVRVRMTPEVVGQVIGQMDWGRSYHVRLGGSTESCWFSDVELEPYKPKNAAGNFGHDDEPEKGLPPHLSNIIDLEKIRIKGMARA